MRSSSEIRMRAVKDRKAEGESGEGVAILEGVRGLKVHVYNVQYS